MSTAVAAGLALSYVNRIDGALHLRLELPGFTDSTVDRVQMRLLGSGSSKLGDGVIVRTPQATFVEVTFPPGRLSAGAWHVQVGNSAIKRFEDTGARVVVADPNPISILIGFDPAKQVPRPYVPAPSHTLPRKQQWAKSAGVLADRALTELPAARADSIRTVLRRTARKVIAALPD